MKSFKEDSDDLKMQRDFQLTEFHIKMQHMQKIRRKMKQRQTRTIRLLYQWIDNVKYEDMISLGLTLGGAINDQGQLSSFPSTQ